MAKKDQLRELRAGTVINATSKKQEKDVIKALRGVEADIKTNHPGVRLHHAGEWKLSDIVRHLRGPFPDVAFDCFFETSSIRPDGGILSVVSASGEAFPILIAEVKNQGTNDLRAAEGKPRQARGNAIERLGKNVIGLRAAMRSESIFPFVCFGYGCDFEPDSSILDRVVTIAMFGRLCETHLHDEGPRGYFDRGSYYFRPEPWTVDEMQAIMLDIADRAILYYKSKFGTKSFEVD